MNERIEILLAELDIDLYTDEGVMMTRILVRPKDLSLFAQLIVQECALQCVYDEDMDLIENHFGVEL
jgi:hypothetical protein